SCPIGADSVLMDTWHDLRETLMQGEQRSYPHLFPLFSPIFHTIPFLCLLLLSSSILLASFPPKPGVVGGSVAELLHSTPLTNKTSLPLHPHDLRQLSSIPFPFPTSQCNTSAVVLGRVELMLHTPLKGEERSY
ncbi:unnamed protein product, partial [Closterium sp. Naga37s-1]